MEHCLHESIAHLTPDAKASIFKCVLEYFQGVSNITRNMAFPLNTLLTVDKTGYICGGANILLGDYDAVQKSIVMKRNIFNAIQRVFADSAFGTKCRPFSVVLV